MLSAHPGSPQPAGRHPAARPPARSWPSPGPVSQIPAAEQGQQVLIFENAAGFLAAADRPPVLDLPDHAVTPKAPWTGSGWRGDSYGGPGGGRRTSTAGNPTRPQEGDHAGFRPSRPSVWSRTGAFEATGTGGPKAGPRAAGS